MAFIKTVAPEDAHGLLARLYAEATKRAGKVFNINRIMSLRPHVLQVMTRLYMELMLSPRGNLPRRQREMIAVAVSRANECGYWTRAHADDLRAEVANEGAAGEAMVTALCEESSRAPGITDAERGMLDFAVKLTRHVGGMERADVERLRSLGFDDGAIHDIVQITALFNHYNRLAEGLGVDDE